MRLLYTIGVDKHVLTLFYRSIIGSVITFSFVSWFRLANKKDQNKICKIIRAARKMGVKTKSLNDIYDESCIKMVNKILKHSSHPLYSSFQYLRSGKRLCIPKHHTSRYANTFVVHAIKLYNFKSK